MKKSYFILLLLLTIVVPFFSCIEDKEGEPMLIIKFRFDPNQARLNNFGQPSRLVHTYAK